MICPDCLEELIFIRFDVDPQTLEHRGVFRCECDVELFLPESMTREVLTDEDLKKQLQLSRLFHLQEFVRSQPPGAFLQPAEGLRAHTRHLLRYLQDFTEHSLRQLK